MPEHSHLFSAMGSPCTIRIDTYIQQQPQKIQRLHSNLIAEIESLEQCFSRFRAESELTRLNEKLGQTVEISEVMSRLLHIAEEMVERTNGAFDPRVYSSMQAIGYEGAGPHQKEMIDHSCIPAEENYTRPFILWKGDRFIELQQAIDLGGIAKGHTADLVAESIESAIRGEELAGYIVDIGGDLVVHGTQQNGESWNVGIENPFLPDQLAAVIELPAQQSQHTAICTSSIWKKTWVHENKRVHHLINPHNGAPMDTTFKSVSVFADQAAVAEAMTKFIFLHEWDAVVEVESNGLAWLVIDQERRLFFSDFVNRLLTYSSKDLKLSLR